mmetsp:Transcript_28964/g.63877  ORF Transcript_28964/g.63877 Transcript_28964/m.63877 type:complete len:228 (-) Transcript_28964:1902-2585(-)
MFLLQLCSLLLKLCALLLRLLQLLKKHLLLLLLLRRGQLCLWHSQALRWQDLGHVLQQLLQLPLMVKQAQHLHASQVVEVQWHVGQQGVLYLGCVLLRGQHVLVLHLPGVREPPVHLKLDGGLAHRAGGRHTLCMALMQPLREACMVIGMSTGQAHSLHTGTPALLLLLIKLVEDGGHSGRGLLLGQDTALREPCSHCSGCSSSCLICSSITCCALCGVACYRCTGI